MYPFVEKGTLKTLVMYTLIASLEELLARKAHFPPHKIQHQKQKTFSLCMSKQSVLCCRDFLSYMEKAAQNINTKRVLRSQKEMFVVWFHAEVR